VPEFSIDLGTGINGTLVETPEIMRTSSAPLPTQDWLTIGLNTWHRAIVRREAERIALGNRTGTFHLEWQHFAKLLEFAQSSPDRECLISHVALVDRKTVVEEWDSFRSICWNGSGRQPVRLLWDWRPTGRTSLDWATELGFSGVVHDFSSLASWTRLIFARLPFRFTEPHPILSKLTIPSLSKSDGPATRNFPAS
jgi:hypothetical protein